MMKKALCMIMTAIMLVSCLFVPDMKVYAANITIGVSSSSVQIGETVTVTVTIPENVSGPINVSLSNDILTFSSSTAKELGVNGKYISISMGKYGLEGTNKVSLTFKAKTSGEVTISASHGDIFDNDSFDPVTLGNASAKVTVNNKATESESQTPSETPKSADNSLSSLKLSSGSTTVKLSPTFKKSTVKYTATVDYSVSEVIVSATRSNEKAQIVSVTDDGKVKLKVGENVIKVVVQAENGEKATYTITVTRKEKAADNPQPSESQTPSQSETTQPEVNEMLQWNGEQLTAASSIPSNVIPTGFESTSLVVNGQQMKGLTFTKGNLKLLYLKNTNGAGSLYVYDEVQQTIYPFIKLSSEKGYVFVLVPNEEVVPAPAGFKACTFSIEGKGIVNAYQFVENTEAASDFYLTFCMNESGESGWYMYDTVEATYQRYFVATTTQQGGNEGEDNTQTEDTQTVDTEVVGAEDKVAALEKELKELKQTQYIIIGVAAAVIVILLIIIIVLIIKNRSKDDDFFDGYDDEDDEEYDEEDEDEESTSTDLLGAVVVEDADDDEIEIEFFEMETPVEEVEDDEIEIEFFEMETPVEEVEDDEIEIEFFEMVEPVETEEIKVEEVKVEEIKYEDIKIERRPRVVDPTSKLSTKKEDDDDDLEFIDFE